MRWQHRRSRDTPDPLRRPRRSTRPLAPASPAGTGVHAAGRGVPRRRRAGVGARPTCSPTPGCAPGARTTWPPSGPAGPWRSATTPCCSSAATTACCAASTTCASTGPTSWRRAGRRRAPLDPLPVPRLALRARRHAAVDAPLRRAGRLRPRSRTGSCRRRRGVARLDHGQRLRRRRAARRRSSTASSRHVADHEPERLVVGATHSYELATNWKLVVENYQECFHCPNIHPELCAVSPSTSGENYDGHHGILGRRLAGPDAARRDDVAERRRRRRRRCAAARRRPPAHRLHRAAARTCSSACTPTT